MNNEMHPGREGNHPPKEIASAVDLRIASGAFLDGLLERGVEEKSAKVIVEGSQLPGAVAGENLPQGVLDLLSPKDRERRARRIGERFARGHGPLAIDHIWDI